MVATGCKPPINLMADKATHQRETRQLIGGITLNPGGPELLVPVFLDAPKCPRGDGVYLKDNIVKVADVYVTPDQVGGFTGDGVYEHCSVGVLINGHYGIKAVFTWDQMHLAATVDSALRNPKKPHAFKFAWLNNMTKTIGKGVTFVAWGMEWHHFFVVI